MGLINIFNNIYEIKMYPSYSSNDIQNSNLRKQIAFNSAINLNDIAKLDEKYFAPLSPSSIKQQQFQEEIDVISNEVYSLNEELHENYMKKINQLSDEVDNLKYENSTMIEEKDTAVNELATSNQHLLRSLDENKKCSQMIHYYKEYEYQMEQKVQTLEKELMHANKKLLELYERRDYPSFQVTNDLDNELFYQKNSTKKIEGSLMDKISRHFSKSRKSMSKRYLK